MLCLLRPTPAVTTNVWLGTRPPHNPSLSASASSNLTLLDSVLSLFLFNRHFYVCLFSFGALPFPLFASTVSESFEFSLLLYPIVLFLSFTSNSFLLLHPSYLFQVSAAIRFFYSSKVCVTSTQNVKTENGHHTTNNSYFRMTFSIFRCREM